MLPRPLIDALLDPATYAHRPPSVRMVSTHISCVFLAGGDVFKVKKPVRFAFLDFSTLAKRRHYCEEEVRLNRRLAPDVYRGVVAITFDGSRWAIDGAGEVVEYAVCMRRLPDDRLLRALVERGEADAPLMHAIAAKMAAFHADAASTPTIAVADTVATLARSLAQDTAVLRAAPHPDAERVDALDRLLGSALRVNTPTLRARQAAGRVRDCHGDLRPDHVCCTEGLPIIDCIEFSADIRHCDVAAEMAFLAVELTGLDAAALADTLIAAYVATSGDAELPRVLPFFRAYRAQVRAMVAALTAAETTDDEERGRLEADAARYLALAERDAWRAHPPALIAIVGRSGSGKSTLAAALAARTGLDWIRSDVMRKRRAGMAPLERPRDAVAAARLYAPEHTVDLYGALADETAACLARGTGAIVDATFLRRDQRARLLAVAASHGALLWWIECAADDATVRARLAARAARNDDPSDATWDIARAQSAEAERLDDVRAIDRFTMATADDAVAHVWSWLVDCRVAGS